MELASKAQTPAGWGWVGSLLPIHSPLPGRLVNPNQAGMRRVCMGRGEGRGPHPTWSELPGSLNMKSQGLHTYLRFWSS